MGIEFRKEQKNIEVLTNQRGVLKFTIEYRWDPLTSRVSVLCPHLKEKWTEFYGIKDDNCLKSIIEESKEKCPFCPPVIDNISAKFSKRQIEEEIIKEEGVYVFANLFPRTSFEAVITAPDVHYLNLNEFEKFLLNKFFKASLLCIKKAYSKNNSLLFPVIGCNYLPTAGASLVHFHMQISMQEIPFESLRLQMNSARQYEDENGTNFWQDFVKVNKEREIMQNDNIYWYTPFAPVGFCEVRAIMNKDNFLDFTEEDTKEISSGISNILKYYNNCGFSAFNLCVFSNSLDKQNKNFVSGIQIVARPNPRPVYLNIDSWYMPYMLGQAIILESPENLGKKLKKYFGL